jgi:hypothetical protein
MKKFRIEAIKKIARICEEDITDEFIATYDELMVTVQKVVKNLDIGCSLGVEGRTITRIE